MRYGTWLEMNPTHPLAQKTPATPQRQSMTSERNIQYHRFAEERNQNLRIYRLEQYATSPSLGRKHKGGEIYLVLQYIKARHERR